MVAGTASLYLTVRVASFPLEYQPQLRPQEMQLGVAGTGIHVARALRALGDEARLCTIVGADPPGAAIRAELDAAGLAGPEVVTGPHSSLGAVLVGPDGERMGMPYLVQVEREDYPAETFAQALAGADLAVLTTAGFVRPLVDEAAQAGVPVAVDAHLIADIHDEYCRPWLQLADILFCSHEQLPCAPTEWIRRVFAEYSCGIAAVGQGATGCTLGLRDGRLVQVAAVAPRGVRNTSGAGDALFASFLHSWLASGNPVEALESAVLYAGWKVGAPVPAEVHPTAADLARLRAAHQVRAVLGRWDQS